MLIKMRLYLWVIEKKIEIMINRINKNIKKLKKISSSFKIYLI